MKLRTPQFTVWAHCGEDGWCPVSETFNRRWKADAERRRLNRRYVFGKPYYRRPRVVRHVVTQSDIEEYAEMRRESI